MNEINLAAIGIDLSLYEEEAQARQERRARKKSTGAGREPIAKVHSDLQFSLHAFDTVLLARNLPPLCYQDSNDGGDVLRVLVDAKKRTAASTNVPDWTPGSMLAGRSVDPQRLTEYLSAWLASFEPSNAFLADATSRIRGSGFN